MGFFSKLFGDSEEGKKAASFFDELLKNAEKAKKEEKKKPEEDKPEQNTANTAAQTQEMYDEEEDGPSGDSWGPRMPAEPNQYNFGGSYLEYFKTVYAEEFPTYRLEVEKRSKKITMLTLWDGNKKALVVDLLSASSEAKGMRRRCREQHIPYLRFYYDYHGWWNTRSYVVRRSREAMGL